MRQWLRCVWEIHRKALSLLGTRLRVLWKQPWKIRLVLGASFLPYLVVPLVGGVSGAEALPFAIFLTVQIAGVLRHPFQPRPGVIHPLPVWYFWLIQVLGATGVTFLWSVPESGLFAWVEEVHGHLALLALLSLATTAVPAALAYLQSMADCSFHARFRISVPVLYLVLLLVTLVTTVTFEGINEGSDRLVFFVIFLLPAVPSVLLYKKPWVRSVAPVVAVLPQLGPWVVLVLFISTHYRSLGEMSLPFFIAGVSAQIGAGLYWLFLRLRVSLAEELSQKTRDEALSVQTDPTRYVDTSGHGAQLLKFIHRSDGGVLGITGVRGAGKSALTAFVLSQLEKNYFVLSMAAPIRPDPGLGFLSSVCRAVCRRILDNVQGALYGRRTQEARARSEVLKLARNLGIVASLVGLATVALIKWMPVRWVEEPVPSSRSTSSILEPCEELLQAEREMTDGLLKEIQTALRETRPLAPASHKSLHYRIIPSSEIARLVLLPEPRKMEAPPLSEPAITIYYYLVTSGTSVSFLSLDALGTCSSSDVTGRQMQAIRHFFDGGIVSANPPETPSEPVFEEPYLRFEEPHPDWLSLFVIEKSVQAPGLTVGLDRLRELELLVKTYRNTLDGRTMAFTAPSLGAAAGSIPPTAWVLLPLTLLLLVGGWIWRALSSLARAAMNWRYMALFREARQFLEQLNYSESLETKGGLSWKALSLERSRSLAARDLTLPGLTSRYLEFVQSARGYYNGKLVIAIDELDKIHDPEMVKALLTEIKGALFAKGCYYLISISEDATRAFRQRLSSGRDIFESTFDDVIELSQMSTDVASAMIERRAETSKEEARIPASCHFVLALAGGGIPREIVRHLRKISLAHEKDASALEPGPVAAEILRAEVEAWDAGLAEVELSGEETIALRQEARAILRDLRGAGFGLPACGRVWERLEKCLGLIDPAKLRRTVVLLPGAEVEKDVPEAARYRALVDDIQGCLRLMILTTVCELAWRGDEAWKEHEAALLAAYRALADKPALAETLLGEVRASLGPEVCARTEKNPPPGLPRSLPPDRPGGEAPPPPAA